MFAVIQAENGRGQGLTSILIVANHRTVRMISSYQHLLLLLPKVPLSNGLDDSPTRHQQPNDNTPKRVFPGRKQTTEPVVFVQVPEDQTCSKEGDDSGEELCGGTVGQEGIWMRSVAMEARRMRCGQVDLNSRLMTHFCPNARKSRDRVMLQQSESQDGTRRTTTITTIDVHFDNPALTPSVLYN